MDTSGLGTSIDQLMQALSSGNQAAAQEAIRQFNLTYTNSVGNLYGQNFGVGQPAPTNAQTLAAGQAVGSVGYIPGETGLGSSQTIQGLQADAALANQNAANTGFYNTPQQSQYSPGSFIQIDPSTFDVGKYNTQLDYVLPSGQLQRVTPDQARAMGWNGNLGTLDLIPFTKAAQLEGAPPQGTPQQTLQSLTDYSNLNQAANNQAIAQAGVTGMFTAPNAIVPPGTNVSGGKFSDLDPGTQNAYYASNGNSWQAAMNKWVADSNNAIKQALVAQGGTWDPNAPGGNAANAAKPQETQQAQQQYFNQAQALAAMNGLNYTPGMPGSPTAGVTGATGLTPGQVVRNGAGQLGIVSQYGTITPTDASNPMAYQALQANGGIPTLTDQQWMSGQGQETLAAQNQYANQANQLATLYGQYYSPLAPGQTGQAGVNTPNPGQLTLQAINDQNTTGLGLLNLASTLHADPFRQLQIMYGANNMPGINAAVNGLTSRYGLPSSFTAPAGSATNNLGGMAQAYQNAGNGTTTGGLTPQQLAAATGLTNTNQIVTRNFNAASPEAQNAATSALSMNTGQDQADITKQIQKNLPQFTSPSFGLASV